MSNNLINPSFLFRYALPLLRADAEWPKCAPLGAEFRLLNFTVFDEAPQFAEVRGAWNQGGLVFTVVVKGKRQPPWCREGRLDESDGFHLWIDTRNTKNIHRASRFCHRFVFLPCGGGNRIDQPVAEQVLINRARENAQPVRPGVLEARAGRCQDGYALDCFVPGSALTGFNREEYPALGFYYAVTDRELGTQTLAYSGDFPFEEDPSLWCSVSLAG
jgi:hypothetical protein